MSQLLIYNIKTLYSNNNLAPVKGKLMQDISSIDNAYIFIEDKIIKNIGSGDYKHLITKDTEVFDALNSIAIPGLVDSHTHLVFGGSREHEFSKKIAGVDYLDILKSGGGILSTVQQTKEASFEELYNQAKKSLDIMLSFGVTTLEAKSGYGLELETEIKSLRVLKKLKENHPIDVHITYLGAHALPSEYKTRREEFIETIINDLEVIKNEDLAEYADVFCETGVFTATETKRILSKAKALGFKLRVHTDEIDSIGGTEVALDLEAKTVDHLMAITDEDIKKIAKTNTIANLLPSTSFFLNKEFAPARKLIDAGAAVSVSSDYNPGSTPSENYQLTLQISGNKLRMLPQEVLTAATINPAFSLDLENQVGSLQVGKQADILLLDCKNLDYFIYHYGINHTKFVFKNGKLVFKQQQELI
ncbi:MAG: imidazolonepropionase [Tenericutes bacterium HGW-Tenericutes-5]|nr:MAG: imidazolonepropionase [Tenericutes bacterium HGW-Tenericutes-5]